jgi:acyl-CoA reductase-like NAD-dependent aldehyde dehydrogenase
MSPSKLDPTISFTTFSNIVDGEARSSKTKYHGIDPTTRKPNWDVPVATPADVDDAVAAANRAFDSWKKTTWEYRTERLARYRDAFESYHDELAELLSKETGKPKQFAAAEVDTSFAFFDWHLAMKEPKGETYDKPDKTVVNKFVPLGVAAAICPWNVSFSPTYLSLIFFFARLHA